MRRHGYLIVPLGEDGKHGLQDSGEGIASTLQVAVQEYSVYVLSRVRNRRVIDIDEDIRTRRVGVSLVAGCN